MPLNLLRSPTPIFLPLTPFSSPTVLSPNTRISTKAHHFHPLTISKTFLALAHLSSPLSQSSYQEEVEEEEEDVIGDCLVFEEGAFDDPFLKPDFDARIPTKRKPTPVSEQSLIPEEWKEAQAEINMTKKEKRVIAKQLEFGSRLERNRVRREPPAAILDKEAYQSFKLSQLKPVVLDPPESPLPQEPVESSDGDGRVAGHASIGRAAPKDPRVGVADSSLEDIAKFLNSNEYQPGENGRQNSQGPRKLFTKEEKVLLNKKIPNLADATSGKWLPLHTLAASGEFYLVDKLLKHNVDINAADKDGLTALHRAILGKKQAITNYLLRESANPFVCDKEGATLMHYAVQVASIPTIKILLLYNVDINLPDDDGWTPLHLAVQTKRTDVVKLLLIKGADKTLKNQDGLTPLDLCLYSGQDVQTYELIKLLKELPKL